MKRAQDLPSKVVRPGHDNPQSGPFFITGAEPGDTQAVDPNYTVVPKFPKRFLPKPGR